MRTYQVQVGPSDGEMQVVSVEAESESGIYKLARAAAGYPADGPRAIGDVRVSVRVLSSQRVGAAEADERVYSVQLSGVAHSQSPSIRAQSPEEALEAARKHFGDGVVSVGISSRVTDAEIVHEHLQIADDLSIEEAAQELGLNVEFDGGADNEYDSHPAHFVFDDDSVLDEDGREPHPTLDDWMSDLGDAANEQLIKDFHAGDSGYRDAGDRTREAYAARAELRSKDGVGPRPSLAPTTQPAAPAPQVGDGADIER